jgi:hypothetical protein
LVHFIVNTLGHSRRMHHIAAHLVDDLLPEAPYRQWVLSFPWVLRFRLAVEAGEWLAQVAALLETLAAGHTEAAAASQA